MNARDLLDPAIVPALAAFPFEHIDEHVWVQTRTAPPRVVPLADDVARRDEAVPADTGCR
jgi:hypothetical protein